MRSSSIRTFRLEFLDFLKKPFPGIYDPPDPPPPDRAKALSEMAKLTPAVAEVRKTPGGAQLVVDGKVSNACFYMGEYDFKVAGEFGADLVVAGETWAFSHGGPAWRAFAEEKLTRFVRRLKASPAGNIVVGFHLLGGMDGQFVQWEYRPHHGHFDYSEGNRRALGEYQKGIYGSEAALRVAWGDDEVTFATAANPSGLARNLNAMARRAKDEWGRPSVVELWWTTAIWPQPSRLALDEKVGMPPDDAGYELQITRDAASVIAAGGKGLCFYDMLGSWYHEKEASASIRKVVAIQSFVTAHAGEYERPSTLILMDEQARLLREACVNEQPSVCWRTSGLTPSIRLTSDLADPSFPSYRLCLLWNAVGLTRAQADVLRSRVASGMTLVAVGRTGICSRDFASEDEALEALGPGVRAPHRGTGPRRLRPRGHAGRSADGKDVGAGAAVVSGHPGERSRGHGVFACRDEVIPVPDRLGF